MLSLMHVQGAKGMDELVRSIYESGQPVLDNAVVLFRNILQTGVGYVLGSVLHRVASNTKQGAGVKDTERHSSSFGSIFQTFRVKKLSIHPPQPEAEVCAGKPFDPEVRVSGENSWRRYQRWLHRDVIGYEPEDDDGGNDVDADDNDADGDTDGGDIEDERPHTHLDEERTGDGPGFYSCRR